VELVSRSATLSTWRVVGSATYAEIGTYTVTVTVDDVDGTPAIQTSNMSVSVADAALTDTTPVATFDALQGNDSGTLVLATFTDANPFASPDDFTPTVDWGGTLVGTPTVSVQFVSSSATASTWRVRGRCGLRGPGNIQRHGDG